MKRVDLKSDGFTLVELLVVISIIAILSSLTIATISFASAKAGRDRAKSEIAGLAVALESYKIDNGDYPRDAKTDTLNAVTEVNSGTGKNALISNTGDITDFMRASVRLYVELSGDTDNNRTGGDKDATTKEKAKVYFQFKPNMLYPRRGVGSTDNVKAFIDPFLNVYGYSTIGSKANRDAAAEGYNATFDLWSTADRDRRGQTIPTAWLTNW